MRSFDADIVTELAKLEIRAFWLVELQFDTTYRFTDCDIDLRVDGQTYQSDQGLKISNIGQGAGFSTDRVTMEFGNVGLWMSATLLNEDVANDTVIIRHVMYSAEVPIMAGTSPHGVMFEDSGSGVVFEDTGDGVEFVGGEYYSMIADPAVIFNGMVSSYKLTEKSAVIEAVTEFMLWRKKALRLPAPSCPWAFTGTECGYSGAEEWCDQSVERCKELSNYNSFGGRRYIAYLEDQKIWWGSKK